MKKEYKTGPKKAVIDFFRENSERHFSVPEVVDAVSQSGVGKSTVYRLITNLFESGVVRRFETPDSQQFVYQYADKSHECESHYHLKCVKCGRLIHMECVHFKEVCDHIEKEHSFIIGSKQSVIFGECVACSSEN